MRRNAVGPIFAPTTTVNPVEKVALAACLYVSFCLIMRLWLRHRQDKFIRKVLWSFVLLVPLFGWIFYGAFYQPLQSGDNPCPQNPNILGGSG